MERNSKMTKETIENLEQKLEMATMYFDKLHNEISEIEVIKCF